MSGWSPQGTIELGSQRANACVKSEFSSAGSIEYFATIGIEHRVLCYDSWDSQLCRTSRKLSARECERILAPPGFFNSIPKIFENIVLCIF